MLELAGNDLTRMDEIANLNLYVVFNYITYKHQKADLENYKNNNNRR
jgi:hypothetical protein